MASRNSSKKSFAPFPSCPLSVHNERNFSLKVKQASDPNCGN
jgi:hypothetical protein